MAKRRAEDILLNSPPSKRSYRGLRLDCMAPPCSGGVSPPSLLTLLGSRCRKRHISFEETEETNLDLTIFGKSAHGDLFATKHAANVTSVQLQTSGNFQATQISADNRLKNSSKRAREDCEARADTVNPKARVKVDADSTDTEDSSYNYFQFWRTPLPELDMSLLQEPLQKDSSSDTMEV